MTSRWTASAVVLVVAMGVAGCGSADDSNTPEAVKSAATVVPTDLDSAAAGDQDLDGEADNGAELTSDEFCGFLAKETPKVVDLQPAEYAAASFGSAVLDFYTEKGLLTDIDGADMDDLAAKGCPGRAARLLPALGAGSFADALSQ